MVNTEQLLTTQEAADILKLEPQTLANMRAKREGPPFVKIGRLVRYRFRDLMKFIDQNIIDPSAA